ncbi:uncharacterized protein LOC111346564 [Stylophora pistillata]|uniref:uncharacterized protein LOC111346564 n=1 Tax=Stylophora pistillata TaxID=50429 RepID=UPI000C049BFD|nr:uncharacterized protein LOC111346564 [Stylophora pistillata]
MACSSVSTAASSQDEKKEQRLIDVMFLCDEWKSSKGGLSTLNREFAINLAETTTRSMKIHCYVSQSDDRDRVDAKQHGVNLITAETVPGSRDPLDWLKVPPLELQHPDVVIGHGRKLATPACLIVRAAKCKWIQFVHVFCEDLGKFKETTATAVTYTIEENEEKHKMEIELCEAADAVVAFGSRLQQKYSRSLPKMEVKIITPGIVEKFCIESIESGNPARVLSRTLTAFKSYMFMKKFNVFMFGRATYEDLTLKGYDIVANAIGSLGVKFELTFVGSPPGGHRELEQWFIQKTCIKRRQITIRGYCTEQDELKKMFHQSDLVALPSRTEGFGLVALEAISSGVAILVSGESGVAEALQEVDGGDSVIVKSDDDAVEWARRISEVSSQSPEDREAKARQLRENYRKVYSWGEQCERFKGLIENVVKIANADAELNITTDVEDLKPAESINQATTSTFRKAEYQRASVAPTTMEGVSNTGKEDIQALEKKALSLIIINYLETTPPQSADERKDFKEYLKEMKLIMKSFYEGSLVITVKCESLQILEELWKDYSSGHLGEVVQNCFVTEKILKELNLAELRLKTTVDIEEYNACKMYFEKVALREALSAQSYFTSTESKAQLERRKQKTEVVESEKVKSTGYEGVKEFIELEGRLKTFRGRKEIRECTSLSSVLSTAGHEKELEGRLQTFTLQEEKRILPPSEEELEELLMKLQGMKGAWPVPEFSASDPEEELSELRLTLQGILEGE